MKLSRVERWILSNQYRILEALSKDKPHEVEFLSQAREAIERGYEMHYGTFSQHIDNETLSEGACKEVVDVMAMFRALNQGYDRLDDKEGIDAYRLRFHGFDGNNEGSLMAYAQYYCNHDGGRFAEFQEQDGFDDFNSHVEMLDRYRAMMTEWNKSANKNKLTKEDIARITSAD